MSEPVTIMLVDDEPQIRRWLGPALRAAGYQVEAAETGGQALAWLTGSRCDLILLDQSGIDLHEVFHIVLT